MIPTIASLPLLSSLISPSALASADLFLEKPRGSKKVQRNRVWDEVRIAVEVWEVTRLSSTHVMGSSSLRPPLKESNEENDLPLSRIRKCIPLLRRGSSSVWVRSSIGLDREWEVDSVALNDVSYIDKLRLFQIMIWYRTNFYSPTKAAIATHPCLTSA